MANTPNLFVGDALQVGPICTDFLYQKSLLGGRAQITSKTVCGAAPNIPTSNVTLGPSLDPPGLPAVEVFGISNIFGNLNIFAFSEHMGISHYLGACLKDGISSNNGLHLKNSLNLGNSATVLNGAVDINGITTLKGGLDVTGPVLITGVPPAKLQVLVDTFILGKVDIVGSFNVGGEVGALVKLFDIPHPSKPNYRLKHACLEGPEIAVYYRGRLVDDNKITLPDFWENLINPESITVYFTPRRYYQELYVKSIDWGKVINVVNNSGSNIDCDYIVYAERIDVEKLKVEVKE